MSDVDVLALMMKEIEELAKTTADYVARHDKQHSTFNDALSKTIDAWNDNFSKIRAFCEIMQGRIERLEAAERERQIDMIDTVLRSQPYKEHWC